MPDTQASPSTPSQAHAKKKPRGKVESRSATPKAANQQPMTSFRVRPVVVQAAAVRGVSLQKFVADAALKEAEHVIERERLIQLTEADALMIQSLLDAPPAPNAEMLKAVEAHQRLIDG